MELMTKYQYTYFIYPYVIEEKKYKRYLQNLLSNKKCKIRFFDKQKDIHLFTYFLPKIREYMFWSFGLNKSAIRDFEKLDTTVKSTLLSEHDCNMFSYDLPENLQGKVESDNGIFFEISEIKIICFKTGVSFLIFKTNLENSDKFSDVLNFNYKFREINSASYGLKEYENIKIQSNAFKDIKDISKIIKEIIGNESISKKVNLGNEKFYTYSYACIDQKDWNENSDEEELNNLFEKYRSVSPVNSQIANDKYTLKDDGEEAKLVYKNQYIKYGFTVSNTVLFTSNINTTNFTIVPQKYESEYMYTYILTLYKKIYLNKLIYDMKKSSNFERVRRKFIKFTQDIWIQEATNDETGAMLYDDWQEALGIQKEYKEIKNRYDVEYKDYNIEKTKKSNKLITVLLVTTIILNIIGFIILYIKGGI